MNKLQAFIKRLRVSGLTDSQIEKAIDALNEYNRARFAEMQNAQQGSKEVSE